MKACAHTILTILIIFGAALVGLAQELPPNFEYKRETGQETGVPYFILTPSTTAMSYDAMRGSTFEALGALVQPERDKYGLMFTNAKETSQFDKEKEKIVILRIDGEEIKLGPYKLLETRPMGLLKIDIALITIDKKIFDALVKARDVLIRVGSVAYNLDQDNIDALHYFGREIQKDIARRTRPKTP